MTIAAILVGNESLTVQCGQALMARGHRVAAVVTAAPEVRRWAEGQGLRVAAQDAGAPARLSGLAADWLISAANLAILPPDLLALARAGAMNFHDGPLPRHAGLNAPVWAILQGEAEHGVAWHLIEGGVDEGAHPRRTPLRHRPRRDRADAQRPLHGGGDRDLRRGAGGDRARHARPPPAGPVRAHLARTPRPAAGGGADRLGRAGSGHPAACPRARPRAGLPQPAGLPEGRDRGGRVPRARGRGGGGRRRAGHGAGGRSRRADGRGGGRRGAA